MLTCTSYVLAETPEDLAGTWMIDTKATEESLIHTQPFKDATSFIFAIHYLGNLTSEFDGKKLFIGTVPNTGEKIEHLLVFDHGSERKYIKKDNNEARHLPITISIPNNKNIIINFPATPEMQYLLWKRVKLDPNKTTPNDFKPEFDAFIEMIKNISKAFDPTLNPVVKTDVKP